METLLTTTVFTLLPGEVASLSVGAGHRLTVEDAAGLDLWVTRDNDSADYWLRCGASMPIERAQQIVVSVDPRAERPVRLALAAPARRPAGASLAQLAARLLRRLVRGTEWTPCKEVCNA
ncbi:DUF2917 domain-containing protein [Cupriavidus sp. AU9028]|uniref:DUF2917 domain-containing protein n=1 Tax=Cupriavidus sp. AU9028 TaxID=2871157 RepID=UPI001C965172|nr:DUF2917 domain-containing protein [Cupriavidus sp. AU9028]MBY4896775.1 DUF2917 domain-containing protein [Cupriavidus sp. AU9028]